MYNNQLFEILILSPDYLGNKTSCLKNQPHFLMKFYKSLLSSEQSKQQKNQKQFCRRNTTEDDNVKIKVSPNIPCTFLLFKASECF